MAQLSGFNVFLPQNQNYFYGWCGQNDLRDNLVRTQTSFADFKLTAAQMDTLNATPVAILAAPGAGLMNIVQSIVTYVAPGVTPFELGSGTLGYLTTDGSGAAVATAVPNASVESASAVYYLSVPLAVAPIANVAIVVKASADVTAGDGLVYGRIFYRTINVGELLY